MKCESCNKNDWDYYNKEDGHICGVCYTFIYHPLESFNNYPKDKIFKMRVNK
tara:strand:- start:864 stop:1019 length:156 start_codon:yes stop_codon:yes gene_type:complete